MKIIVLCGGTSPEREVSLNSGKAVGDALREFGHDAEVVDITSICEFLSDRKNYKADGVFIALHGGWGEDGRLQAALEAFEIPFTGSGSAACMLAMDKSAAKLAFADAGVPVPEGFTATKKNNNIDRAEALLKKTGKIIVKPNGGGSTVGVTPLTDIDDYMHALELSWQYEEKALVEEFIDGEEITVPLAENAHNQTFTLPAIHIKPKVGFYDYKNKYTHGNTEYICPADLPDEITGRLSKLAILAHNSLGCRVYNRIDFRLSRDNKLYALESNTAPGMTSTSLVPKAAKAYGYTFGGFLDEIIRTSFAIDRWKK
ncbi:MAG: D-alanine--D-alanine ligase [Synergistes sp.]|nr:D-alanine--D-alanine ligase [Synergistes sp.]